MVAAALRHAAVASDARRTELLEVLHAKDCANRVLPEPVGPISRILDLDNSTLPSAAAGQIKRNYRQFAEIATDKTAFLVKFFNAHTHNRRPEIACTQLPERVNIAGIC